MRNCCIRMFRGGIDAIYSSNNAGLKLYFICEPTASLSEIALSFEGNDTLRIVNNWGLQVETSIGNYEFEKPRVYQLDSSGNVIVLPWTLSWTIQSPNVASFSSFGEYDMDEILVIEISKPNPLPFMHLSNPEWSTAFGGSGIDELTACINDADGNFFVTGFSSDLAFPVTPGQLPYNSKLESIIGKFGNIIDAPYPSPNADRQMWTTYFGGSGDEKGVSIACVGTGSTGKVYVVGETTEGISIFDNGNNNSYNQSVSNGGKEAFLLRLNNLDGGTDPLDLWSTLIGGMNDDIAKVIKSDPSGNIFIAGQTKSSGTTSFCQDPSDNNFPLCHSLTSAIFHSTNNGNGDGFLIMFDSNEDLKLSTFLGGDGEDAINGITIDNNGNVYVCGITSDDSNFPIGNSGVYDQTTYGGGNFDGFVIKYNSDISHNWGTLFGGNGDDIFNNIAHDSQNNIYLVGQTSSSTPASSNAGTSPCPTTSFNCLVPPTGQYPMCDPGGNAFFQFDGLCNNGIFRGVFDGTITEFDTDGELIWSTYYGGDLEDNITGIAINEDDLIFFTGSTFSQTFFPTRLHGGMYLDSDINPPISGKNVFLGHFDSDISNYHDLSWGTFYNSFGQSHPLSFEESASAICVFDDPVIQGAYYWYMVGQTSSTNCFIRNFPCCPQAHLSPFVANSDGLISRFSSLSMWMPKVQEIKNEIGNIRLYPNPASSTLKVKINFNKLSEYSIQITNVTGNIIYRNTVSDRIFSETIQLNLDDFSNGIYFLSVLTVDGIISSKFLIQK